MFFINIGPQRENGTNQKIRQTGVSIRLCFHLSLLKSTLPRLHTSATRLTAHLTHTISSKHSMLSSLLSFLCWLHTALSLISTRWSNGSCKYLKLLGRHLGMDERTSPTARPGKDWASCLPCHSNSTAWFHHPARFFYNYPIKFSQKSWCNFRWPADIQKPHCKNCSILPVCIAQHQKDQALHSMQHNFLSRPF